MQYPRAPREKKSFAQTLRTAGTTSDIALLDSRSVAIANGIMRRCAEANADVAMLSSKPNVARVIRLGADVFPVSVDDQTARPNVPFCRHNALIFAG